MNENYKINIERERVVINVLGEVCWGFPIDDFESIIGEKKEVVESLLRRLISNEKTGIIETCLTASEVAFIRRSLCAIEREIEEWEFPIRIGYSLEEVKKMPIFSNHTESETDV